MKLKILLLLLLCTIMIGSVHAQTSGVGVGLILGEPTGISFKSWMNSSYALNGAAAWSFVNTGAVHIHADYVFHNFDLFHRDVGKMAFYYGLGGRLKLTNNSRLGVRVPLGLNYMLKDNPLDIFLEVVPMLDLAPATTFTVNAAIGIRYFF